MTLGATAPRPVVTFGWSAFADRAIGIDRFGASAPGPKLTERLGITPDQVATAVRRDLLVRREGGVAPGRSVR